MKLNIVRSYDDINIIPKYYKVIESEKLRISYLLVLGIRIYITNKKRTKKRKYCAFIKGGKND